MAERLVESKGEWSVGVGGLKQCLCGQGVGWYRATLLFAPAVVSLLYPSCNRWLRMSQIDIGGKADA